MTDERTTGRSFASLGLERWPHLSPARAAHLARLHSGPSAKPRKLSDAERMRRQQARCIVWFPEMVAAVHAGIASGRSATWIADRLGISVCTLAKFMRKNELRTQSNRGRRLRT